MTVRKQKLFSRCCELIDCWTYSNPDTLDFVVGWLCKCLSKTCRIEEFQLNYVSFIITSGFCFKSSEDCILLLECVTTNSDGVLAFFRFFLTYRENYVGTKRSFLAFLIIF